MDERFAMAALRELVACADWAQEIDDADDVPSEVDIGACGTRFKEAWAAARAIIGPAAPSDQSQEVVR